MYQYSTEKPRILTDEGQRDFLRIRDHVFDTLKASGAITMGAAINKITGDSWGKMACVDRMVELGELVEVKYGECCGQDRIFVKAAR